MSTLKLIAKTLVYGKANGDIICLDEPLSFWGGFDATTGTICDQKHPQVNEVLSKKILLMPSGRGSSSASSILAESIRRGTGPKAIILKEADPIIVLGAVVAAELYKIDCPVVQANANDWQSLVEAKKVQVHAFEDGHAELDLSLAE